MRTLKILLTCSIFVLAPLTHAQDLTKQFSDILVKFKKGAYVQTIKDLQKFKRNTKYAPMAYYWTALCYNRLQEYDKSIPNFIGALKRKVKAKDLYYEYGQALYAALSYKKARKSFIKSAQANYKRPTSLYYVAFISQALEQYGVAAKYYERINRLDNVDISILQASNFQLAEVLLIQAQKSPKPVARIKEIVMPQFERAFDIDDDSVTSKDITRRMSEVKKKYGLGPERWVNGRIIPKKRYRAYIRQRAAHDDNVLLEAADSTTRDLNTDSFLTTTTLFGRYQFIENARIGIAPELKMFYTKHYRNNPNTIIQNDTYSISPALRTVVQHKLFSKMANIIFDVEYNYTARDRLGNEDLIFFGSSLAFVIGESFRIFNFGDTQLRFKYKNFTSFAEENNAITRSLLFTQNVLFPFKHFLVLNANLDFLDNANDLNSTNTYTFIMNYIMSKFAGIKWLSVNLGFTYTILDTRRQEPTRGTERTYSPSARLDIALTDNLQFTLDYKHAKKNSKDRATYAYEQNVYGAELEFNF